LSSTIFEKVTKNPDFEATTKSGFFNLMTLRLVLVWKKYQLLSKAEQVFLEHIKAKLQA
jgi:hypothetical protein